MDERDSGGSLDLIEVKHLKSSVVVFSHLNRTK